MEYLVFDHSIVTIGQARLAQIHSPDYNYDKELFDGNDMWNPSIKEEAEKNYTFRLDHPANEGGITIYRGTLEQCHCFKQAYVDCLNGEGKAHNRKAVPIEAIVAQMDNIWTQIAARQNQQSQ